MSEYIWTPFVSDLFLYLNRKVIITIKIDQITLFDRYTEVIKYNKHFNYYIRMLSPIRVQSAFWHRLTIKKKTMTHVFRLGRAPLSRHTEERHAAFPLPLQYSGFRFPFGAQQTVTFTVAARRLRVSSSFFLLPLPIFFCHKSPTRNDHYWQL